MRNSGRVSLLAVAFTAMIVLVLAAFVFAKEEPGAVGAQFMTALAKHDVEKLTELSYIGKQDPAEIEASRKKLREEWDFAVNTSGKHYAFAWKISASNKANANHASVTLQVQRNILSGGSYDEKYELPMELEGGKWRVDVGSISSEMFPGLPR